MRIIAGQARGKRLHAPAGRNVRPTADRVREALFSSLGGLVEGAGVLDLFAGSGALGLEALSRGAGRAVFVERSRTAAAAVVRNIAALGFEDRSRVLTADWARALRILEGERQRFELLFLDPPYGRDGSTSILDQALAALVHTALIAPAARIVAEHPRERGIAAPAGFRVLGTKVYGGTGLTVIEREG